MKTESRIVGIDDASFNRFKDKKTLIIATFYRGGNYMDGVLSTLVDVDGNDATDNISKMILYSKFYSSIRCVMLKGVAVAGFNIIDIEKLSNNIKRPVIVIMRKKPDTKRIFRVLKKINMEEKIKLIKKAGKVYTIDKLLVQYKGTNLKQVKEFLKITCTHSHIPEPLRIAHIIGSGIIKGESRGRA